MTRIFFVRHAQSDHSQGNEKTRPLTKEGVKDAEKVLDFFKTKEISNFYSSPYRRSIQTIAPTAHYFHKEILLDDRLRERQSGPNGNTHALFKKRWDDKNFHEDGGESIFMLQKRNIAALSDILKDNEGKSVIIATHGTALSSILHYFDNRFAYHSFIRILDWMPYLIELDFNGQDYLKRIEHLYIPRPYIKKSGS